MNLTKARLEFAHDGQVARVVLAAPKANILDRIMMAALQAIFEELAARRDLKAVILTGDGPSFSYGASVQEHLPDQIAGTLEQLRHLLVMVTNAPAPTIAAVRGQCLGGGFELALASDLILAEENAQFACPEIKLGVFPPAAAALLPGKVGLGWASHMILTGASWTGTTAAQCGLVSCVTPAGELDTALEKWLESDFLPRSATALRYTARAIRQPALRALEKDLPNLERMYLDELMMEPDAIEGMHAFLEKRQPQWGHPRLVG
jgi:cyclohexa-1,5-dienecarbonyl-CoA hydratase